MIKIETIGMFDIAKINPILTSETDVVNNTLVTIDDELYLVDNTLSGDDCGKADAVIPAGEFLNGYRVKDWEGQKLIIDDSHIAYGDEETYADSIEADVILTLGEDGTFAIADEAPASGIYFKVTDKTTLTGKAVKAVIVVA